MSDLDLPGMLALQKGVAEQQWPHTIDARIWAEKFNETIVSHNEQPYDPEMMVGWFANAIMAGYDTAAQRKSHDVARWAEQIREVLESADTFLIHTRAEVQRLLKEWP